MNDREEVVAEIYHIMSATSPYGEIVQFVTIDGCLYKMEAKYHPVVIHGGVVTESHLFSMKLTRLVEG